MAASPNTGGHIQKNSGKALGTLPHQGWRPSGHDFLPDGPGRMHIAQPDGDIPSLPRHDKQDAETDSLTQNGSKRRSGHAHVESENEQRVQEHVQEPADGNAHHAESGAALEPQVVVQHQAGHHPGGSHEDDPHILDGIGQDGRSGTDQRGQLGSEQVPQEGDQDSADKGIEKSRGSHHFRLLTLFGTQETAHAMA